MGQRTSRRNLRKSLALACLSLSASLFLPALTGGAAAADLTLSSKTYGLFYERELAGGQKDGNAHRQRGAEGVLVVGDAKPLEGRTPLLGAGIRCISILCLFDINAILGPRT